MSEHADAITFEVELIPTEAGGSAYYVAPFSVEERFGTRARLLVAGTINGYPFRSSLSPRGDGTHYMVVNREVRAGAQALGGDTIQVTLWEDREPRVAQVPDDLAAGLATSEGASRYWESLSYSHQKEYVEWISSAKREATRERRVAKALQLLAEGKHAK